MLKGDARKGFKDLALASSLKSFGENRIKFALNAPLEEAGNTIVFEMIYEALKEFIDALLALEGYKPYSHTASIAFLQKFSEFSPTDLAKLDNAREKRHKAKYYGKTTTLAETKELIELYHKLHPKLVQRYKHLGGK